MRAIAAMAGLVASFSLVTASAVAAPEDHVSGSGKTENGTHFNGTAHGTPLAARGQFHIEFGPFGKRKFNIDCLMVDGNRAAASGPFVDQPGPVGADRGVVLVEDNGSGKKDPPDRVLAALTFPGQNEPDCGFYRFFSIGTVPLSQGNFVVKDR
jgi:hypothetical protein